MKRMSILIAIACLAVAGCADPLEQRTTQEVQGNAESPAREQSARWSDLRATQPQSMASHRLIRSVR
jgi:PBP1b-binding outer membrane lipoprotein LpoB